MTEQQKRIVDFEHPWLGLESFTEQTKQFFYGRDEEVRDLFLRVRENPLTVLYGQSGLGKSSLLGAGLIPKLRIEGFRPCLLRLDYESSNRLSLVEQTRQAFESALSGVVLPNGKASSKILTPGLSLWANFHRDPNPIELLHELPPVLIFDQFEEIFTLAGRNERSREAEELLRQLSDLVENRPPFELQERFRSEPTLKRDYSWNPSQVRVVLALRDDYLSHLQGWKNFMPAVMRNQMALQLLSGPKALQAVVRPGQLGGRDLVTEEVGARIVRFVAKCPPQTPLNEIEAVPPLVSLVCDELNSARLAVQESIITPDRVDVQSADILQSFYEQSFEGWHSSLRDFVEDRLITVGGHRIPVAREDAEAELASAGVQEPSAALAHLVQRRLLVPEERGSVQQLWITHDVLTPLVVRSRDERRERMRVREADEQARKFRQERHRALALAAVFGFLFVLSILAGLYGWSQARLATAQAEAAKQREIEAQAAKSREVQARAEAESRKAAAEETASSLEASLARADYFVALMRWSEGRVEEAQNLLRRVPFRYRNFEWYLDNRYFAGGYMTLYGHTESVSRVVFSPDGKSIISGSDDGTVRLWDAVSGAEQRTLAGDGSLFPRLLFDTDGTTVASISLTTDREPEPVIELWDVASGQRRNQLTGIMEDVSTIAVSPDGMRIAAASESGKIKLWDTASGAELWTTTVAENDLVKCLEFSPDGTQLAAGTDSGRIRLLDAASGLERQVDIDQMDSISSLAFSGDGSVIAAGYTHGGLIWTPDSGSVGLWDAQSGKELLTLYGHQDYVSCVAFSPDGRWLASGSLDNTIKIWDAFTGQELRTLQGHVDGIASLVFRPDGAALASGSWDHTIKLWDLRNERESDKFRGHEGIVNTVAFNPDGTILASGGATFFLEGDNSIKLWDVGSGKSMRTLEGHTDSIASVAFSPDGSRLASGSVDKKIKLWDVASGLEILSVDDISELMNVRFSPDGSTLVSQSLDSTINFWDAKSGLPQRTQLGVTSVALSPDGTRMVSGRDDLTIRLSDVQSGQELRSFFYGELGSVDSLVFFPDGRRIVSIVFSSDNWSSDSAVTFWDTEKGEKLFTLPRQNGPVSSVVLSPDGTRIVTLNENETIKLWDAVNGQELRTLFGHSEEVTCSAFNPDGTWLASSSKDGTVYLWDAPRDIECRILEDVEYCAALAVSPDETRIAAGLLDMDHSIQLWDAATGMKLRRFEGHTDDVHGLEFSPDGTRIVSGSADMTVKLWDLNSGREIRTFAGHAGPIEKVSFHADGTKILSQGFDGSRIVWDTTTGLQLQPMDAVVWNSSLVGSGDERWRILPYKNSIRVIDLQFKHDLRERQCRQRRASPDSLWHLEHAEASEATNQWYAATYHRAWVVESLNRAWAFESFKREEQSDDLRFIDAPEKLREAYSKWRESLENSTDNKLADPDILLQPSVRNVLQSIKEE